MLGGEKFPPIEDVLPIAEKGVQFYNAYGVTEMSVWQSLIKVECRKDSQRCEEVPISHSATLFTDLGLRNTWVKLIHAGEVVDEGETEGELAVYSDVRHCAQSPALHSDQGWVTYLYHFDSYVQGA